MQQRIYLTYFLVMILAVVALPLPNPLEWSTLATVFSWFARQSPVYFQTPENEELLRRMREQGLELTESLLLQVDCISGAGAGVNDPVVRSLADYRQALESLVAGLRAQDGVLAECIRLPEHAAVRMPARITRIATTANG